MHDFLVPVASGRTFMLPNNFSVPVHAAKVRTMHYVMLDVKSEDSFLLAYHANFSDATVYPDYRQYYDDNVFVILSSPENFLEAFAPNPVKFALNIYTFNVWNKLFPESVDIQVPAIWEVYEILVSDNIRLVWARILFSPHFSEFMGLSQEAFEAMDIDCVVPDIFRELLVEVNSSRPDLYLISQLSSAYDVLNPKQPERNPDYIAVENGSTVRLFPNEFVVGDKTYFRVDEGKYEIGDLIYIGSEIPYSNKYVINGGGGYNYKPFDTTTFNRPYRLAPPEKTWKELVAEACFDKPTVGRALDYGNAEDLIHLERARLVEKVDVATEGNLSVRTQGLILVEPNGKVWDGPNLNEVINQFSVREWLNLGFKSTVYRRRTLPEYRFEGFTVFQQQGPGTATGQGLGQRPKQ